ncbi:hypothetical protein GGX14DRAFT_577911 [Mycena pura]|uniref:Uncharacterized protein n=1 Tax=Mycena pura TaxID=153505 RepID=A0AAD6UV65_9AGAR|nr:hypothetical protein GGX14DRAFT_577911 [Mycena pura]
MGISQSITSTSTKSPGSPPTGNLKLKPTIAVTTPTPPNPLQVASSQPRTTDDPPPAGASTSPPPLPPPTTKAPAPTSASSSTGSAGPPIPAASANRVADGSSDSPLPSQLASTFGILSKSFPSDSFPAVPASTLAPSALASRPSPASATASVSISSDSSSTATTSAAASVNPGSKHVPVPVWIVAPILGFAALVAIAGFVAYRSGRRHATGARGQRPFTELRAGSRTSAYGSQFDNPGRGPGEFLRVETCTSDPETPRQSRRSAPAIAHEAALAALPDTSLGPWPFRAPPSPSPPAYSPTTIGAHWQPGDHHPGSSPSMRAPTSESDTVGPTSRSPPPYDSSWRLQPPLPVASYDQKVV